MTFEHLDTPTPWNYYVESKFNFQLSKNKNLAHPKMLCIKTNSAV